MNRFFAMLLLLPLACMGQTRYQKGYFVDQSGKKTECLIKNSDWRNNPTEFEYKLNESSSVESRSLSNTSEFAFENGVKYVRATVPMERSSEKIGLLQRDANYNLKEETHFFKVLFESSSTLYTYEENGFQKFFVKFADKPIQQLVYIKYLGPNAEIREYSLYKSQLLENYSCEGATLESLKNVKYLVSSLISYYDKIVACKGETKTAEIKKKKGNLNLRPFVGFKSMKFDTNPDSNGNSEVSTNKSTVAYGLELEYILPTNNNKWAFILAIENNRIKEKQDLPDGIGIVDKRAEIDYSAIQVPFGARYYSYLSDDFKLFANAMIVFNLVSNDSKVEYDGGTSLFDTVYMEGNSYNFAVGAGLSYKKFNAELRYYTPQGLYKVIEGDFKKVSFTVSYAIF